MNNLIWSLRKMFKRCAICKQHLSRDPIFQVGPTTGVVVHKSCLDVRLDLVTREPDSVVESLAEYAHDSWCGWMRYMFSKGHRNESGAWAINEGSVERWTRQMRTAYADLSDDEKVSDKEQAAKILQVLMRHKEKHAD